MRVLFHVCSGNGGLPTFHSTTFKDNRSWRTKRKSESQKLSRPGLLEDKNKTLAMGNIARDKLKEGWPERV